MNILAIGDVVGENGCNFLRSKLGKVKKENNVDLVIANAENSAKGNGISKTSMKYIFDSGVDVITTGNHCFRHNNVYSCFDEEPYLIRPANYPVLTPGKGYCIIDMLRFKVCVINLLGVVFLQSMDCPFKTADAIIDEIKNEVSVIIVDFHAEATSEKGALAHYLDGRISAFFGTHTHVQTADEKILPNGTGFITDVGMTGAVNSILGVKPKLVIRKMKDKLPTAFSVEESKSHMDCIIFNVDKTSGDCKGVNRFSIA